MTQLVHVSFVVLKYFSLLRVYTYTMEPRYLGNPGPASAAMVFKPSNGLDSL